MPRREMRRKRRSPEPKRGVRKWNAGAFPIHNPAGVAAVLGEILAVGWALEWDPKERKPKAIWGRTKAQELELAANQFRISYSTLHRLSHGTSKRVSWRVARRLEDVVRGFDDALQRDWWTRLGAHLFSPAVQGVQDEYRGYLVRELGALEEKHPEMQDALLGREAERVALKFERRARAIGAPMARVRLATLRVYDSVLGWEPLYRSLERSDDLLLLVRLGYRRELILMQGELRALHSVS